MEINPTIFCTLPLAILGALAIITVCLTYAACVRSGQISEAERRAGKDA